VAREDLEASLLKRKLRPDYLDCGRICALQRKRQKGICEGCAVKTIEDGFRDDCLAYFKEIEGSEKYDFDSVLVDYYAICALENGVPENGYRDGWNVLICRLVDILRSERHRRRRIDDYEFEKKLENQNK
jgi:hypothetical protein